LAGLLTSGVSISVQPGFSHPQGAASGNELLTTFPTRFDPLRDSGVSPPPTEQEALMTILDPKTGQLVTIDLTSKPRRI
jgi:hypothetical protein